MKKLPTPLRLSKDSVLVISRTENLKKSALEIERSAYSMAGLIEPTTVGELMLLSAQIEHIAKKLYCEQTDLCAASNQPEMPD